MSIVPPQQLNYRVLGPENSHTAPYPVVFLHGLMGFSANWGKIWPYFQEKRPILVLDQRGHGRSAKPETGYSPIDYANDLATLLQHLQWQHCHIVGHSMGGRVALIFCKLFPQHAASLTLEDSGMEANSTRIGWIKNLLASIPTPFLEKEEAKKFFEENFRHDPMTGSFLHANLETKKNGALDWRFHAPGMVETIEKGRAEDAMEIFSHLTLPTLVIRGERSIEFPKDEFLRMAASRSNVQLVEIAGAGHYVHAEKPAEFSRVLENFLSHSEK